MQYQSADTPEEGFLARVQQHAGLTSRSEARSATDGTLETLATAVSSGQMAELARYLPASLLPEANGARQAVAVDKRTFLDTVGGSVRSTDPEEVEILVGAVLSTVREQLPDDRVDDTLAQLPPALADLFHAAPGTRD